MAAETAAREAAEAANADLEATRQHAFELKVRTAADMYIVVRVAS